MADSGAEEGTTPQVPVDALASHTSSLGTTDPLAAYPDPEGLDAVFEDTRVIGLGEATHGTREFFQLKHRLIRYLVREHDLRVVALEANLPETLAVDEYVVHGRGDPRDALDGIYFWTWNVESVLSLVEWLRRFNKGRPVEDRVRFYGVDTQYTTGAVAHLRDYLETVGATLTEELATGLDTVDDEGKNPDSDETPDERREVAQRVADELRAHLDEQRETYVDRAGERAWQLARRQAAVVESAAEYRQARAEALRASDRDERVALERLLRCRDRAMAENVDWLLALEDADCLAVWGHDAHVNRSKHAVRDRPVATTPMGGFLADRHGEDYLAVGFSLCRGSFQAICETETDDGDSTHELLAHTLDGPRPGTLEAHLDELGVSPALVDIRAAGGDDRTADWVDTPRGTFSAGARYDPDSPGQYITEYVPGEAFDAVCHVTETSRARPLDSDR